MSAAGIAARSAAVSGGPSSRVKAKRPPGRSAEEDLAHQGVLVLEGEHRLQEEDDQTPKRSERREQVFIYPAQGFATGSNFPVGCLHASIAAGRHFCRVAIQALRANRPGTHLI